MIEDERDLTPGVEAAVVVVVEFGGRDAEAGKDKVVGTFVALARGSPFHRNYLLQNPTFDLQVSSMKSE